MHTVASLLRTRPPVAEQGDQVGRSYIVLERDAVGAKGVQRIIHLRSAAARSSSTINGMGYQHERTGWMWAIFTARWVLGLIFFMAGWWKCFELTPKGHAEQFFIGQFDETWIPHWLLWAIGTSIPVLELGAACWYASVLRGS